jgi:hypothetical protein
MTVADLLIALQMLYTPMMYTGGMTEERLGMQHALSRSWHRITRDGQLVRYCRLMLVPRQQWVSGCRKVLV